MGQFIGCWFMIPYDSDADEILHEKYGRDHAQRLVARVLGEVAPKWNGSQRKGAAPRPSDRPRILASIDSTARVVSGLGSTYVLVVGIDGYGDTEIPSLRFAEADAREVANFFSTDRRSPADGDRVRTLFGAEATRVALIRAIREHLVAKATRPEDLAILFFAGHGFSDARGTYLATHDTSLTLLAETSLEGAKLQQLWSEIGAGRKLLITDACHSGGLKGLRGIGGVRLAPVASESPHAGSGPPPLSMSIASASENEKAAEDERLGHGVFTVALLNGLRGDADADGDRTITSNELGAYVTREVPMLATRVQGKQTPVVDVSDDAVAIPLTR
jgi:uncharacterized caspase-like protein